MKRWDTQKTPWLRVAEGERGQRLILQFRPRAADWMYVIVLGVFPLAVLILMVAFGIPIANTRPGPQPVGLIVFLGISILFVGAMTISNFLKHWCLVDIHCGGPVKKRNAIGAEDNLITTGLKELPVRYFVTCGRNVQHVCALESVAGGPPVEVHRCYGRQAKALAEKLRLIVRESGFQQEHLPV